MLIESRYTKSFISNSLTDKKYNELYEFAILINKRKNLISNEINSNLLFYLDFSFFEFLKLMREKYKGSISSNFDKQLYEDVFKAYQNKLKSATQNIKFENIKFIGSEFYKRDVKNKKRGDFKKYKIKKESTKLSICLTYLSRYGHEGTIDYINNQIKNGGLSNDKILFYKNILRLCEKFGFDRLLSLAISKRNRILNKYKKPIEFKSLTFRGRCRLLDIISYNKNFNSKINSFISLSWLNKGEKLHIPVNFNKEYHGNIKDYHKNNSDYEYIVVFADNGKVKINFCKDGLRYIPEDKKEFVGIDVNVKNNLFSLSNGETFDYNRKLLNDLTSELLKIDKLKKNKEYVVGKKKQKKLNSIRNKIQKSNESLCVDVCKHLNKEKFDHVVFENLNNSFGKSYIKDENDLNFNRIVSALCISSLKDKFERIARKYDIAFSTVHPEYTSKTCSVCGCIEDENRLTQEHFKCVDCGYENNADINAAINIKQRVSVAVLRDKLLKQTKIGNGSFEPKILKREMVKELLLSFRQNPETGREVSPMNRFENF
jgi:transposase